MSDNLYKCTPRQLAGYIEDTVFAGLVPFVRSSPGMGKSSIMKQVFKKNNLKMIDHRLSTSAPEDMTGLPEFYTNEQGKRRARFVPFGDLFPLQGDPIPDGYQGWGLFLDEMNSAEEQVQAAAYKILLDKMTGQEELHERLVITAAGNHDTDRAMTNPIGTALQSRVVHFELQLNFKQWLEDVAFAENYDPIVIAFLSQYETHLMDFKPDHNDKTFCCPRTWEFVNRLAKVKGGINKKDAPLYAGTITSGVAAKLVNYAHIKDDLISFEDVMKDPEGCPVPDRSDGQWIITTLLSGKASEETLDSLGKYMDKLPMTNRVLFWRGVLAQKPELRPHPAFSRGMIVLNRYLNDGNTVGVHG